MVLDISTKNSRGCRLLAWLMQYITGEPVHQRGRYRILFSQKYQHGAASLELVEVWPRCFHGYQGTPRVGRTSRHLVTCRKKGGLLPEKTQSEETKVESSSEALTDLDFCNFWYRTSGLIW